MTDRTIPRDHIERTVATIDPDWRVLAADPAEGGALPVYRLSVETHAGTRECYLKASPEGEDPWIDVEARLLSLIGGATSVPVPEVYGAIDEGGDLPAPCFLMSAVDGRIVERPDFGTVDPSVHEGIARSVGEHLAAVHALEPFEAYGYLEVADGEPLRGERPPADPSTVRVADPTEDWRERMRLEGDHELEKAADTRFGDAADGVASVLHERIDWLSGPFEPRICHVDFALENLPHDPETGEVRGMIDWAFTVAAPPDYDLLYAVRSLSGGHLRLVPDTPDRRDLVRSAVIEGYESAGSTAVVERYRENRDAYSLLAKVREANIFESAFDHPGIGGQRREAAAERLASELADPG
ncbi:hypothetical protein BRD00_14170 [Halobacteriales archaeon QS_8_69_26]|nr:MAG: hypothetical protein BRD00_14170 [Halobacteriales archaeon QS_8_69_26]